MTGDGAPPPPPVLTKFTSQELKELLNAAVGGAKGGRRTPVTMESEEFQQLLRNFRATSPEHVVLYVESVSNELLRLNYGTLLRNMEKRDDGVGANQHWLWHGTHHDVIRQIVTKGFNRSHSKTAMYGKGEDTHPHTRACAHTHRDTRRYTLYIRTHSRRCLLCSRQRIFYS